MFKHQYIPDNHLLIGILDAYTPGVKQKPLIMSIYYRKML